MLTQTAPWTEFQAMEMARLLKEPTISAAITRIRLATLPESGSVLGATPEQAMIRVGYIAGRADVLRELEFLAHAASTLPPGGRGKVPGDEEWGHIAPQPENEPESN